MRLSLCAVTSCHGIILYTKRKPILETTPKIIRPKKRSPHSYRSKGYKVQTQGFFCLQDDGNSLQENGLGRRDNTAHVEYVFPLKQIKLR